MKNRYLLAMLAALSLSATACETVECGAGTQKDGDKCVPLCGDGQVWDTASESCVQAPDCALGTHLDTTSGDCIPDDCALGTHRDETTGTCVPDECVTGSHRDETTGACVPDSADCVSGQVWDVDSSTCIDADDLCSDGTTWVASQASCIPDDELLVADLYEGSDENDPTIGGNTAFESFTLPATHASIVLGGHISAPADLDGDGALEADYDWWIFQTTAPALIRVSADGVGGATSGFYLLSVDDNPLSVTRGAIGTTSDLAVRDVYLPRAGLWAIAMTDASNLLTSSGPYFGGEGFGYFVTVTNMQIPTATPLTFSSSQATATGSWPVSLDSNSMLGFYTISAAQLSLLQFDVTASDANATPALLVSDNSGAIISAVAGDSLPATRGFEDAGTLLVVPDVVWWFGNLDTTYTLTATQLPVTTLEDSAALSVQQPAFPDQVDDLPFSYLAFVATEGDIVSVKFTNDATGEGYADVVDYTISTSFGSVLGSDGDEIYTAYLRFRAPYTGMYIVRTLGLAGAEWGWFGLNAVPALTFAPTFDLFSQTPTALGAITTPYSATGLSIASADKWENFYTITPGTPVEIAVTPATAVTPVIATYNAVSTSGALTAVASSGSPMGHLFTASDALFGIAAADQSAFGYDLAITPIAFDDLGTVSEAAPIENTTAQLLTGESRRYYQFSASAPGDYTLAVTPAAADIMVTIFDASLNTIATVNAGAGVETYTGQISVGTPAYFRVATASGAAVTADEALTIQVTIDEFATESEANNDRASADAITPPVKLVGNVAAADTDWYAFTTTGPVSFSALTSAFGASPVGDTIMYLYAADGTTVIASNDDIDTWGGNWYSQLGLVLSNPGTYYLVVTGYSASTTGDYLLTVNAEAIQTLTLPATVQASLAVGEVDMYAVSIPSAGTLSAATSVYLTTTDTRLYLIGTDGATQLAYNDDANGGVYSTLSYNITAAGTYYLVVDEYGRNNAGDYQLDVSFTPTP